jgi:hypothetical protein
MADTDPNLPPPPSDAPDPVDGGLPESLLLALPFPLILVSIGIAFFGRKIRRMYALTLGIAAGMAIIQATVPSGSAGLGSKGALFCVCTLGLILIGLLAILIRHVASGAALGAVFGMFTLVHFFSLDSGSISLTISVNCL